MFRSKLVFFPPLFYSGAKGEGEMDLGNSGFKGLTQIKSPPKWKVFKSKNGLASRSRIRDNWRGQSYVKCIKDDFVYLNQFYVTPKVISMSGTASVVYEYNTGVIHPGVLFHPSPLPNFASQPLTKAIQTFTIPSHGKKWELKYRNAWYRPYLIVIILGGTPGIESEVETSGTRNLNGFLEPVVIPDRMGTLDDPTGCPRHGNF